MLKVINLFGGPGSGKSTTASGLFYKMKILGFSVELATEFAKDLVFEDRKSTLEDQVYIFAKQNRKMERLKGKIDWVITDSPLPLATIYTPDQYYDNFAPLLFEVWNSYENHNFVIKRDHEYKTEGRMQTEQEAIDIDHKIDDMLIKNNIQYQYVTNHPSIDRIDQILKSLGLI